MTVLELVDRERLRLRRLYVGGGIALVVASTALLLAAGAFTLGGARWMALPRPVPFLVWAVVIGADVAVFVFTKRLLLRRTTRHGVAEAIEREQAMRAGALRGAMEVADTGALGKRAAARVTDQLTPVGPRLAPATLRSVGRGVLQAALAAVIAIGALGAAAPRFNDGLLAIMRPVAAWKGTLLPKLGFANLPPAVLRGEPLRLQIDAPRRGSVTVAWRVPGEAWAQQTVSVDARNGVATMDLGPLRGDLSLVASDGRSASDTVLVRVTDRPFVGAVSMRATYPAYLGRAAEALAVGEPARVPQGTVIELSGRASTSLHDVRLASVGDTIALGVNDHAFSGRVAARKSGKYAWLANGAAGSIADVPPALELDVVPDSAPRVDLVSPATDSVVAASDRVTLHVSATDDHAISRIEIVSWVQGMYGPAQPAVTQRLAEGASSLWNGAPSVDLAPRNLKPGDALHLKIVATDNSPWAQRGESRELLLKVPTMEERRSAVRSALDSAVSQARAAAQSERALQERTADATRDRSQNGADAQSNASGSANQKGSMSYDAAEKAKAVAKDQRALTDQVKQLQQTAGALQEQLKQAGALDSSLSRQLQEAQNMLRDALTPELLAQMQKLESSTQQLSRDQAQASLKDLQAQQQKLREQLEKSAEMLKRAALEGSMETMKDEAKEIADRNRAMADSAAKPSSQNQTQTAAQQQMMKELADRAQRFEDELKELKDRLAKEKAEAAASNIENAQEHADAAEEAMRKASGQSENKNTQISKADSAKAAQNAKPGEAGQKAQTGQQRSQQDQNGQQNQSAKGERPGDKGSASKSESGSMQDQAKEAASEMDQASDEMKEARQSQVNAWKGELNNALDQSIQEMLQMARQEQQLQQRTKSGDAKPEDLRGEQSAIKQGVDNAAQRLEQQGQKSTLMSGRSQRSVQEAQQKVAQAMQSTGSPQGAQQTASALGEAADALNQAAASLARDREKSNTSGSATGFAEMLQQMQDAAKKQSSINSQAQSLIPMPGQQQMSSQQQATARALAREQRQVSDQLDDISESAGGDRAAQLAKEAKQLAEALEGGRLDGTTLARQQQLFRRLLDAGHALEKEEREDTNKREATSAKGGNELEPDNTDATGKSATKFREPTWDELRGLSADERRAILEYFKRINGQNR